MQVQQSTEEKQTRVAEAAKYREHGKKADNESSNPEQFKRKFRVPETQHQPDSGRAGKDEEVSTATVSNIREELHNEGNPPPKTNKVIGSFSEARTDVVTETWTTGDPKQPIAAHPGGLTKVKGDNRRGLTQGHNPRDQTRANLVKAQYDAGNKDPKKGQKEIVDQTKIAAEAATVKDFQQPAQQLDEIDPSSATSDVHSAKFGPIIIDKTKGEGLEPLKNAQNKERETKKFELAGSLIESGLEQTVPDETQESLEKYGSPESAIKATSRRKQSSDNSNRPAESQALQGITKDHQMTLNEMNAKKVHVVSPPRSPLANKKSRQEDSGA